MVRPREPEVARRNRYRELLSTERAHALSWPRHDARLLAKLEADESLVVWGYLAGTASPVARLDPDGTATPLGHDDPEAVAFLEGVSA